MPIRCSAFISSFQLCIHHFYVLNFQGRHVLNDRVSIYKVYGVIYSTCGGFGVFQSKVDWTQKERVCNNTFLLLQFPESCVELCWSILWGHRKWGWKLHWEQELKLYCLHVYLKSCSSALQLFSFDIAISIQHHNSETCGTIFHSIQLNWHQYVSPLYKYCIHQVDRIFILFYKPR